MFQLDMECILKTQFYILRHKKNKRCLNILRSPRLNTAIPKDMYLHFQDIKGSLLRLKALKVLLGRFEKAMYL